MSLYLLELSYTDKESQALYPAEGQEPYADELALSATFDIKLGQAMKSDAYKGEVLVAFDSTGKIIDSAFHYKDNVEAPISDRLVTITKTASGESPSLKKETSLNALEGDAYERRGNAKNDPTKLAILNLGVTGSTIVLNDYWSRPSVPVVEE